MKPQTAQLSLQVAGRLSHFLHNWEVLTTDKWVLETVKGFQVPFVGHPVQEHRPNAPTYSTDSDSRRGEGFVRKGCCPSFWYPRKEVN